MSKRQDYGKVHVKSLVRRESTLSNSHPYEETQGWEQSRVELREFWLSNSKVIPYIESPTMS